MTEGASRHSEDRRAAAGALRRRAGTIQACLASVPVAALLAVAAPAVGAPEAAAAGIVSGLSGPAVEGPFEKRVSSVTRDLLRTARRNVRRSVYLIRYSLQYWWKLLRRTLLFAAWAMVVGLVDLRLIDAWRREGLSVLRREVPSLLHLELALLLDRRADRLGRWLLVVTVAYGVWWRDLIPDRHLVPGLIDDLLLIAAAMRLFLARCGEGLVAEHASRALAWRERVKALTRARRPAK